MNCMINERKFIYRVVCKSQTKRNEMMWSQCKTKRITCIATRTNANWNTRIIIAKCHTTNFWKCATNWTRNDRNNYCVHNRIHIANTHDWLQLRWISRRTRFDKQFRKFAHYVWILHVQQSNTNANRKMSNARIQSCNVNWRMIYKLFDAHQFDVHWIVCKSQTQ